jgi:cytosine/adenosine deaminase-related metal-dependent hydrolase
MRDAGVKVALGVDGSASNDAGHLIGEARQALLLQRVRNGADAMSAREALEIATLGGARVLGRGAELGSIEPGKRADLAVWDVSGLEAAGTWDPVAALVLCGPFQVRDLLVEGRRVVHDGHLVGLDLPASLERAAARVARLLG